MAKKIPTKNYVILFGIAVLIVCGCFAFYNVYNEVKDNNISSSPLSTHQVLYEDLTDTTVEMNADTLLLVSYVQDESVHNNEKEIRKNTKSCILSFMMNYDIDYKIYEFDAYNKKFEDIVKEDNTSYIIKLDRTDEVQKYLNEKDEVLSDNMIKVYSDVDGIQKILSVLIKNKYKICEMRENVLSLEEAFLKKAGGNIID